MPTSFGAEVEARVLRARIHLAMQLPFLASAVMRLPLVQVSDASWCPTMATNGYTIFYNAAWSQQLSSAELRGVLAHEILHVVFAHPDRMADRDHELWNVACDIAINLLLVQHGFDLPPSTLHDTRFHGLPAETIYARLRQQQLHDAKAIAHSPHTKPSAASGEHSFSMGAGEGPSMENPNSPGILRPVGHDLLSPDDLRPAALTAHDRLDAQARSALAADLQSEMASKLQGSTAGRFRLECQPTPHQRIDWTALMRQWMQERIRSDWSSIPFSRKFIHRGLYMPSCCVEAPGHLMFAIDTSGSMSPAQLSAAWAEVLAFRESFPSELTVVQADAAIQSVQHYEAMDAAVLPPTLLAKGRGGTDFRPVFHLAQTLTEPPPAVLVYATDGLGVYPRSETPFGVLWLLYEPAMQGSPSFGTSIRIAQDFET